MRPTTVDRARHVPITQAIVYPSKPMDPAVSASVVREALAAASRGLIGRGALVEVVALCAVAREHLLVVGPPGTAKSEAVRRVAKAFGGQYFEYLLGRFTEPSEIFGPVNLRKLRDGVVETETTGMLPEAELAFLDEVFLGSTAILNTLLGVLNERVFRRGHVDQKCPLRICVGATNDLPDDESLAAFADRFLARIFVEPIPDPQLEDLLAGGRTLEQAQPAPIALAHLDALAEQAAAATLDGVRPQIAHAIRILRSKGVPLSDRRAVKLQRLVAAAGALAGRAEPTDADLWPIVYSVPTRADQQIAREAMRDLLAASASPTLPAAAEDASMGPLARAARLIEAGDAALAAVDDPERGLRLEGVAREIDAGFTEAQMPDGLLALRQRIVDALEGS